MDLAQGQRELAGGVAIVDTGAQSTVVDRAWADAHGLAYAQSNVVLSTGLLVPLSACGATSIEETEGSSAEASTGEESDTEDSSTGATKTPRTSQTGAEDDVDPRQDGADESGVGEFHAGCVFERKIGRLVARRHPASRSRLRFVPGHIA